MVRFADAQRTVTHDLGMGVDAGVEMRRLGVLRTQLEDLQRQRARLLAERNAVLRRLVECDVSRTELARASGLSQGRITQLLDHHPRARYTES